MNDEKRIIYLQIDASKAVDGSTAATRALEKMERSTASMDSALTRMESSLGKVGGYLKAHLALVLAEIAARFIQMGKDAFKAISGLDELAEQLGITTTGLQALQFSAVQNGVKLEQLETSISKFSQKMGDAANGSKEMVDALNAIGVKNLDLQGKLRPTEALLEDVAAAIIKIDDPAKRAAAAVDFFGKAGTRMLPMLADISAGTDLMAQKAADAGAMIDGSVIKQLDKLADHSEVSALKFRALVATIGAPIATDAMEAVNNILGRLLGNIKELDSQRRQSEQGVLPDSDLKMLQNRADFWNKKAAVERNNARTQTMAERANEALKNATANAGGVVDPAERGAIIQDQYASQILVSGSFPPTQPLAAPGVSTSGVKGAGSSEADARGKAIRDAERASEAEVAYAKASEQSARAVTDLEIHFKALTAAQAAYGKTADANRDGVAALTTELGKLMTAAERAKNLKDFNLATEEMEKANELLAAENRLIDANVYDRALEIAQIKLKHDLQTKGISADTEEGRRAIERRTVALETGEQLKSQAEELKRSQELWTEPLKTALSSIQTTAADAFEGMLNSGKFNFQELGQVFKKMVIRMAAEFMALATVRPVMSVLVNAVSPGMASSFGLGGGSGGGGLFGGSSMPSIGGGDGGISGMFGGVNSFLSQPLGSLFPSATPAGGFADVGALLGSGQTGASAAASGIGGMGGVSIGAGLGAGLGIGMGAYQALTSKSTGGTLGGIGTMIGSGMMLIPGMQIPGMIITALSAILPMLMPEADTRTHSSTNANLNYGGGNWYTTGGAYGAGANSGQGESALRGLTGNIDAAFGLLGGVKDPSKVWGMNASSWTAQGKDWSYTSQATHLVDPSGNKQSWRMNENDMMDTGSAQLVIRSILGGAVGEISSTMTTALNSMSAAAVGMKEAVEGISFVDDVYERLGRGALTVRSQFKELDAAFTKMTETAKKLGLSLAPVEAEQKKATERLGRDFVDNLIDPIAVGLRAWKDEKDSILANVDYIAQHTDVIVDMARINEALLRKEGALKEQLYGGAISQLEDAIKRLLPGGNLANIDPVGTLAGLRATYQSTYAQASAGDAAAIGRFGGESAAYAEYAQSYFAGSPEYNAIKLQIVEALQTVQAVAMGPSVQADGATTAAAANANGAQMQQLLGTVNNLIAELQQERQESAKLRAVLSRYVTTQAA